MSIFQFNMDAPLLSLSPEDSLSLRDAFEGTAIFGGTGSGKTSGSGWNIAKSFLQSGMGGLVLTAKPDEAALWQSYCRALGRADDVRLISPDSGHRLNFLDYEWSRQGRGAGFTQDLVSLVQIAMAGGRGRKSQDPYWDDSTAQELTNAIDLDILANGHVALERVVEIIRSTPTSREEAREIVQRWHYDNLKAGGHATWSDDSFCAQLLLQADGRFGSLSDDQKGDFRETFKFWCHEFALLDPRTRTSISSTLLSRMSGLLRSPYRRLFCSDTTIKPEDSFAGAILILDLPIKEFGETGRFAQVLFKTIWQRAVERRGAGGAPVFLWADEAQHFVTKYDALFQQTARSSRAATVYLTQSVANFRAALSEGDDSPDVTDALLGNFQTKIFHANGDGKTNEWASHTFGESLEWVTTVGASNYDNSISAQQTLRPVVPSLAFTQLKKGGIPNGRTVEGYVFQTGRRWRANNEQNFLLAEFQQESGGQG